VKQQTAYTVDNLSVSFDGKPILRNVSFSVAASTSLAIIGPNGAGKSTLLKCLLRLLTPDTGSILLFDSPITDCPYRELAKQVGYVPQSGVEHVPYTVEEFVLMARYAYLNPFSHFTETDKNVTLRAMEQTEVLPFAQRRMHTLSGGERQKVFIAAALTQEPRIMLLDEPTTFLDYRHQVEVLALISKLRRDTGVTVITVTHDLNQGVFEFDAVLALKEGVTLFHGKPDELLQDGRLENLYGASFRILRDEQSDTKYVFPERVRQ